MPTNPPIGTDYDHIDAMNLGGLTGVVRHMLKDAQAREDVGELKSAIEYIAEGKATISPTSGWENYSFTIRKGWKYKFSATAGQTVFKGIYPDGTYTSNNIISFPSTTTQEYTATDDLIGLRGYNSSSGIVTIATDYNIDGLMNKVGSDESTIQTISTDVNNLKSNNKLIVENVDASKDNVFNANKAYPTKYNFPGKIEKYPFPDDAFNVYDFNIFTDGYNFYTDFNIEAHKVTTVRTFYFSPEGNNNNTGLSESYPKKSLRSMTSNMQDGDTYIFLDGMYDRETLPGTIGKNVNLIAKNKHGAVIVESDNNYEYSAVTGYGNTWHTTRSNVASILLKIGKDAYARLEKKTSISDVNNTPMSFYNTGSDLYINVSGFTPTNENVFLNLDLGTALLNVDSSSQNVTVYIDGIDFIGGTKGTVLFQNSATYKNSVLYAVDCQFLGGCGDDYNAISMLGCDSYFVNCVAAYADRDGFNYHANNGKLAKHLEIGCSGYCNGLFSAQDNNNGTTCHDGEIAIRINGLYYCNKGPNMSDTASGIGGKALFLRCVGFDSLSETDGMNNDIRPAVDMEFWVIACNLSGSAYSLYNPTGNTINMKNCIYTNKVGGGTYNDLP